MRRFSDLPIKHKLTLIGLLTTTVALLLACAGFVAFDLAAFKKDLVSDVSSVAEIIGYNSASALSFNDAASAEQTLRALNAKPHVVAACIYDHNGRVFATYPQGRRAAEFAPPPAGASEHFGPRYLDLFRPIAVSDENVGTIYLRTDLGELRERLTRYALIIGAVMAGAILVTFLIASRLQRLISAPVSDLVAIASRVAAEKNYSVRAVKRGDDELGRLIDSFNDMLGQIQARDSALQSAHDSLERRVEERTAKLVEASGLLETLLKNSPDMIYFKDLTSRFVRVSYAMPGLFGLTDPAMLLGKSDADFFTADHAQPAYADEQEIIRTGQPIIGKLEKETYPEGRVSWALTTKMPWRDGAGAIIGTFGISKDVTALKEAEAKLSYEQDLLRELLDRSPDQIYFKDLQSRFLKSSNAQARNFGMQSVDDLIGKTDFDFFLDEHARPAFEDEKEIIRTGHPLIGQIEKEAFKDGRVGWVLASKMPLRNKAGEIIGTFGISKDITLLKEAEAKLALLNTQLVESSRQAGMAEVATGVLHNVGNVLNSVNVSATLVADHIRHTKALNIVKVSALLEEHKADLAGFLTTDPRGRIIPTYLGTLAESLTAEHKAMLEELEHLRKNVEHIKDIVAMQQAYAKTSGVIETIAVLDMLEDALRINASALARHNVDTRRDYQARPVVTTDKYKVMQILINLVRNAKYACDESGRTDKLITVRTTADDHGVKIAIIDNGIGIPAENLTRIFSHGFTTRKDGHGFGLHSGALAAREIGGSLNVQSDGPGLGAVFTLEIPYRKGVAP